MQARLVHGPYLKSKFPDIEKEVNAKLEAAKFKPYKVIVTTNELNIRKEPSTKSKVVGTAKRGSIYTITDKKNGWGKMAKGWIYLKYTKKVS